MTDLLQTADVAAEYPFGESTLKRWRELNRGPDFIRVGGKILYRRSAIEEWLDRHTVAVTDAP